MIPMNKIIVRWNNGIRININKLNYFSFTEFLGYTKNPHEECQTTHAAFPVYLVLCKIWSAWQPNADFVIPLKNQNIIKFNQIVDDPKVCLREISMILSGLSHCSWINYQINICLNLFTICLINELFYMLHC